MWKAGAPYWIDSGEQAGYYWFQSDTDIADKFIDACSDDSVDSWTITSVFDGSEQWTLDKSGKLSKTQAEFMSSLDKLNWTGNGDEIFVFSAKPKSDVLITRGASEIFPGERLNWMEKSEVNECFQKLSEIGATIYVLIAKYTLLATMDKGVAGQFANSNFVREIPLLHLKDLRSRLQGCLEMEIASEPCANEFCLARRIKYGANCPRHHFQMMYSVPFPDETLNELNARFGEMQD